MTVETSAPVTLVDRIVEAAEAAIRNEAAVLTGDPRRLAMVNLELEIRNGAEVVDYRAWGEWKGTIRRKA